MYYGRGFYGYGYRPMYGPPPPMYGYYGPPPMYGPPPPRYGGRVIYRSGCNVF